MHNIKAIHTSDVQRLTSGQVITDLSTAVKELLDNSLDSGAKQIDITFKNYGIDSIEVTDNGSGIDQQDFENLGLKHYTSKISQFDDIESLTTLGFRGEAISSLCNISKVQIITTKKGPKAYKLHFDHVGKLTGKQITSRNTGTTVIISELFYNLPVRRKEFLRVAKRQFTKCIILLQSYCIINHNVRISVNNLTPNGRKSLLINTRLNSSLKQNIINVFGSNSANGIDIIDIKLNLNPFKDQIAKQHRFDDNYLNNWDEIDYEININGYISKSSFGCGRNSKDRQFIYINSRPIEYPTIAKVVNEIYRLFNNVQLPFFVLNFEINPSLIDINLTPDKRMILFHNEKYVIDVLRHELSNYFHDQELQLPKNVIQNTLSDDFLKSQELKSEFNKDEYDTNEDEMDMDNDDNFQKANYSSNNLNIEILPGNSLLKHKELKLNGDKDFDISRVEEPQVQIYNQIDDLKEATYQDQDKYESSKYGSDSESNTCDDKDSYYDNSNENDNLSSVDDHSKFYSKISGVVQNREEMVDHHASQDEEDEEDEEENVLRKSLNHSDTPLRPSKRQKKSNDHENNHFPAVNDLKQFKHGFTDSNIDKTDYSTYTITELDHSTIEMIIDGEPSYMTATYSTDENGLVTLRDISDDNNKENKSEKSMNNENEQDEYHESNSFAIGNSSLLNETNVRISIPHSQQEIHETIINRTLSSAHSFKSNGNVSSDDDSNDNIYNNSKDKSPILEITIPLDEGVIKLVKSDKINIHSNDTSKMDEMKTSKSTPENITKIIDQEKLINDIQYLNLTVNKNEFTNMRIVGQFNLGFIIVIREKREQNDNGIIEACKKTGTDLFIVDQHASDEKYNFEKLIKETKIQTQLLIAPEVIELSVIDELIVMDNIPIFEKNGFKIKVKDDNPPGQKILLISKPISKHVIFGINDFQELIQLIKDDSGNVSEKVVHIHCSKIRSMLAMRACRMSIMIGKPLIDKKMKEIVSNLGTLNKPWNCPHGRPTMRHLMELENFKRTFKEDYEL